MYKGASTVLINIHKGFNGVLSKAALFKGEPSFQASYIGPYLSLEEKTESCQGFKRGPLLADPLKIEKKISETVILKQSDVLILSTNAVNSY